MKFSTSRLWFVVAAILLAPALASAQDVLSPAEMTRENVEDVYTLGSGDQLRIKIFGEEDLSGEYEVDGSGFISFPLIGQVKAGGKEVRDLEHQLETLLKDGYLINPRASIEILNFRNFYIMGEVKTPGSYPYINGLNVLNAVALAGGYTHRAKEGEVLLRRGEEEIEAGEAFKVLPGDTIRVEERFF